MKKNIFKYISYNEKYDMDNLINYMLLRKKRISKFLIKEYWLDIGVIDDYKEVQEVYNNHFKE